MFVMGVNHEDYKSDLQANERILLLLTGSGLKYLDLLTDSGGSAR